MTWEPRLDGPTNMQRDFALLECFEGAARVYSWDGPWVSLGKSQTPNRALIHPEATRWVVRPTGGKAVLHGHDLTIGIAYPLAKLGLAGETRRLSSVYPAICQPIVRALTRVGLRCELAGNRAGSERGHTADCFAHIAPTDIVDIVTGVKVCGCALRLTSDAVLVQASIPISEPLIDPRDVFTQAWLGWQARDVAGADLAEALALQFP